MQRPNIVYVVCHDLGQHLGCYGAPVPSPAIDAFAAESVVFTNAFSNAPACSPSRGCAMTGRYSHTNGLMGLVNCGWSLPLEERTIVDELNDAGYHTAHFGFQHERANATANRYETEGNLDDPSDWLRRPDEWAENVVDRGIRFLANAPADRPFCLNLGTVEVHGSRWSGGQPEESGQNRAEFYGIDPPEQVFVPPYTPDTPGTREMFGRFQGAIRHLDRQFARLLHAIDEHGLRDNTIVVFTTDHGILTERSKTWLYEQGVEIALIMRVPPGAGGRASGIRYDGLIGNIDVAPSLLDLCRLEVPPAMQGRSFRGVFSGAAYEPRTEVFMERNYHSSYDPMRAVRTPCYHYVRNFARDTVRAWKITDDITLSPWRDGEPLTMWPPRTEPRPAEELYDVERDPGELVNLADDPALAQVRSELSDRLKTWMEDTDDPILRGPIPDMLNTWPGMSTDEVRRALGLGDSGPGGS